MFLIKTKWGYFGRDNVTGNLTLAGTFQEANKYPVGRNAQYVANTLAGSTVVQMLKCGECKSWHEKMKMVMDDVCVTCRDEIADREEERRRERKAEKADDCYPY